jgi:glycosyltransferase involved in cell wall biosynthesis
VKPTVSVIIPTHNRAALVGTALRSVLAQTFQDFEVLVVDDGSSDDTSELCRQFPDARIRWLRHDTARGGGAARNTGITHSRGQYIAFLDDDDEWFPEKLARQMEVMLASPPEVAGVYSGYLIVDRATKRVRGRMIPTRRGDLQAALLQSNPIGGSSSVLLKKSALERAGLFDERLPSFQDRDLWIRISREFHFDYVVEPLLNYYLHGTRVWTNPETLMKGLEIMLEKHGSSAAFRKQCSRRFLDLGLRFCASDQIGRGRRALLRSIGLNPYWIRPYTYLAFTLLGQRVFTFTRQARARMLSHQESRC